MKFHGVCFILLFYLFIYLFGGGVQEHVFFFIKLKLTYYISMKISQYHIDH